MLHGEPGIGLNGKTTLVESHSVSLRESELVRYIGARASINTMRFLIYQSIFNHYITHNKNDISLSIDTRLLTSVLCFMTAFVTL